MMSVDLNIAMFLMDMRAYVWMMILLCAVSIQKDLFISGTVGELIVHGKPAYLAAISPHEALTVVPSNGSLFLSRISVDQVSIRLPEDDLFLYRTADGTTVVISLLEVKNRHRVLLRDELVLVADGTTTHIDIEWRKNQELEALVHAIMMNLPVSNADEREPHANNIKKHLMNAFGNRQELRRHVRETVTTYLQRCTSLQIGIGELGSFAVKDRHGSVLERHSCSSSNWGPDCCSNWLMFSAHALDLADPLDFGEVFGDGIRCLRRVKMEHVLEHLTLPEAIVALKELYRRMIPGGCVRIAVPDGAYALVSAFNTVPTDGSCSTLLTTRLPLTPQQVDDLQALLEKDEQAGHYIMYTLSHMQGLLTHVGFTVTVRESWCPRHQSTEIWNTVDEGRIQRSVAASNEHAHSIIVDACRPA